MGVATLNWTTHGALLKLRMHSATSLPMLLVLLLLVGCASSGGADQWPEDLPPRAHFEQAYRQDSANRKVQSRSEYLQWIVRFYNGSLAMPMGWNDLTGPLLAGLEAEQRADMEEKREELGALIAAEWAKDNSVRTIDTRMLTLWGSVLQYAVLPAERLDALDLIIADARHILAGQLEPLEVNEERYKEKLGMSFEDTWDN